MLQSVARLVPGSTAVARSPVLHDSLDTHPLPNPPPSRGRVSAATATVASTHSRRARKCVNTVADLRGIRRLAAVLFTLGAAPLAHAQGGAAAESKGEYVARAGDCVACHSVPGGKAFAGGLKMGTPLGAIYSTNITPDPDTGIGNYTFEDFDRAVRKGIAKDGHRLYPAMPYPSYAKITDDDMHALYDFFIKEVPPDKGGAAGQTSEQAERDSELFELP